MSLLSHYVIKMKYRGTKWIHFDDDDFQLQLEFRIALIVWLVDHLSYRIVLSTKSFNDLGTLRNDILEYFLMFYSYPCHIESVPSHKNVEKSRIFIWNFSSFALILAFQCWSIWSFGCFCLFLLFPFNAPYILSYRERSLKYSTQFIVTWWRQISFNLTSMRRDEIWRGTPAS